MVADELRRQADHFIDLNLLIDEISRPISDRHHNNGHANTVTRDDDGFDDEVYDEDEDESEFADV